MDSCQNNKQMIEDVLLLNSIETPVVLEICDLSCKYILAGFNKKACTTLAGNIKKEITTVEHCIVGLAGIYIQLNKENYDEFSKTIQQNLTESTYEAVMETFKRHKSQLKEALQSLYPNNSCQYKSLSWRLESQLGTRSHQLSLNPRVLLRLDMEKNGTTESVVLTSDIPNIAHWSQVVDEALSAARSSNSRKIQRIA